MNLQKQNNNKKTQFIYLLVLPKLKISSPTAKEKKNKKQNLRPLPPPLLKSQNTELTAVEQVGAENQEGEYGKINSPNT